LSGWTINRRNGFNAAAVDAIDPAADFILPGCCDFVGGVAGAMTDRLVDFIEPSVVFR
jgi:hypothetical protein